MSKVKSPKHQPTFTSWVFMKQRCLDPKASGFQHYGGRGITICRRWLQSYDNFVADMGQRPQGTTLDRIDVNGNYTRANCRWATPKQQTRWANGVLRSKWHRDKKREGDAKRAADRRELAQPLTPTMDLHTALRILGSIGGRKSAANMTAAQRTARARKAARARYAKQASREVGYITSEGDRI